MNLWLIIPGILLIVSWVIAVFRLDLEFWEPDRTSPAYGVLLVMGLLMGTALLLEGLQPGTFLLR